MKPPRPAWALDSARTLTSLLVMASLLLAPAVASAQPVPPSPTPATATQPPPPPPPTTTKPPPPRQPQPVSSAGLIAKTLAIGAGIGAGVGLLTYAGKHLIAGNTPWTAKGAALAATGGVVGGLAVGALAFYTSAFFALTVGTGGISEKALIWTAAISGVVLGAVIGGLLGGHWGDKWAAKSKPSNTGGGLSSLGGLGGTP